MAMSGSRGLGRIWETLQPKQSSKVSREVIPFSLKIHFFPYTVQTSFFHFPTCSNKGNKILVLFGLIYSLYQTLPNLKRYPLKQRYQHIWTCTGHSTFNPHIMNKNYVKHLLHTVYPCTAPIRKIKYVVYLLEKLTCPSIRSNYNTISL